VVGAGAMGISSAVQILQTHGEKVDVVVLGEKFTPDNTSDGAAGVWYWRDYIQPSRSRFWSKATYDWLKELSRREEAPELGVFKVTVNQISETKEEELPDWTGMTMGLSFISEEELHVMHPKAGYGFKFVSFVVQGSQYIPWLTKRFLAMGGKVIQRKISSLSELCDDFDVVVNCSGLGARELVGDKTVVPVRGQVLRVEAPWIKDCYFYDSEELHNEHRACYIIPQIDSVVIGGTKQDSYNTENSDEDTELIIKRCCDIYPSLKNAKIKQIWTGLRPVRPSVRVEKEVVLVEGKNGIKKPLKVVHNYGHGGSGLTLHHGCALDTCQLVTEILEETATHKPKL